jgi:hypothetical protein
MGINAALAVGSVASSILGNKSAKQAANAQVAATDKATAAQLEMFNKQLELMKPYNQAGTGALSGLTSLVNQQQTPFSFDYSGYMKGPEYAAMQQQYEDAALRNQSAIGGLRSGGSQVALASIAPQLAQQGRQNAMSEYSLNQATVMDDYNRRMGLAGLGLGSAQQSASAAGQFGQQAGNNAITAGNALANKYAQYGQNTQGMLGDIGSIGLKMFGGF